MKLHAQMEVLAAQVSNKVAANEVFLIENVPDLNKAIAQWEKESQIGIDLEGENNLHHYGVYPTLVQISTKQTDWIIDVLALTKEELSPLINFLEKSKTIKIFHDVSFDLRLINAAYNITPTNVYDTQLAARYLNEESIGLTALLKKYLKIEQPESLQKADWTKRPLTQEMVRYAAADSRHLIALKEKLEEVLQSRKKKAWVQEECKAIEQRDWTLKLPTYQSIKGERELTDKQRGVLAELWQLREETAKKVDKPIYFVISNKQLKELAIKQPKLKEWQKLRRVHPQVKRQANLWVDAVNRGKTHPIERKQEIRKRRTKEEKEKIKKFNETLEKTAKKYKTKKHLLMPKEDYQIVLETKQASSLRPWQKSIVEKEKILKDLN